MHRCSECGRATRQAAAGAQRCWANRRTPAHLRPPVLDLNNTVVALSLLPVACGACKGSECGECGNRGGSRPAGPRTMDLLAGYGRWALRGTGRLLRPGCGSGAASAGAAAACRVS